MKLGTGLSRKIGSELTEHKIIVEMSHDSEGISDYFLDIVLIVHIIKTIIVRLIIMKQ